MWGYMSLIEISVAKSDVSGIFIINQVGKNTFNYKYSAFHETCARKPTHSMSFFNTLHIHYTECVAM